MSQDDNSPQMHEIFDAIPQAKVAKIVIERVNKDGSKEWLDDHAPDITLRQVRETYGPGTYHLQAYASGNKIITGAAGSITKTLAGPLEDDEDDEEEEDEEDEEDEEEEEERDGIHAPLRQVDSRPRARNQFADRRDPNSFAGYASPDGYSNGYSNRFGPASPEPVGDQRAVLERLLSMVSADKQKTTMTDDEQVATRKKLQDLQKQIDELTDENRTMRRRHAQEIEDVRTTSAADLRREKNESDARLDSLRREYDKRLQDAEDEHRKNRRKLESAHDEELQRLKTTAMNSSELTSEPLRIRLKATQEDMSRLSDENRRLRDENTRLEEENRKLRVDLGERDLSHKRTVQELELEAKSRAAESRTTGDQPAQPAGSTSLTMLKSIMEMVPTAMTALDALNKAQNGGGMPSSAPAAQRSAPPPIRAGGQQPPSPPPPPTRTPPMASPPRVTPPVPANNGGSTS